MKDHSYSLVICFACIFLLSVGCKTQQKAEKSPIRKKNPAYLLEKLQDNELRYEWLSVRAATDAVIGEEKLDITMKIRIRRDSAIWISVSPALGIEIARIVITQDSIKFLNRVEKSCFKRTIGYLDELTPVGVNYEMLQGLITGNNIVIKDEQESDKPEKHKVEIDGGNYLLSNLKKKKYNKTVQGKKTADATVNRIWLRPKTFKIAKSEITNFKSNKKITATYEQFELIEDQHFAHLVEAVMQADQNVSVKLNYSKVVLNKALKMPFRIPSKYEPIK